MATMWDLIIKNEGLSEFEVTDLGISIDSTSQVDFAELFTYDEIAGSDDLRDAVLAGNLVVNEGTIDLSPADGVDYLAIVHIYYLKDYLNDYYTKTEMQTPGQSAVHWDNITNTPDFGAFHWLDPAIAKVVQFSATPPIAPATGDFYIDTDDDHLYKYNGATWDDQGAPTDGDRVIDLDSTAQVVMEFNGTIWEVNKVPEAGDAIILTDDGDGKSAMYTFTTDDVWVKIADVDILGGSLQQAYETGSEIVIGDSFGPVIFDASASTYAPIQLNEVDVAPSSGLESGQLSYIDQQLYAYDSTAALWLSVDRFQYSFGRKGKTKNQYLNYYVGSMASTLSGFMIPEDAVILNIWGQLKEAGTCVIDIYKNNVEVSITDLTFSASMQASNKGVNISLDANDYLQAECINSADVNDPIVIIEFAYRK